MKALVLAETIDGQKALCAGARTIAGEVALAVVKGAPETGVADKAYDIELPAGEPVENAAAGVKAAYDAAPTEAPADEPEVPEESVTEETTVTTVPESSETEETTIPSEETTVTTTTPAQTTTAYTTTTAATTQAPQTTAQTTSTASGKMITVYVIIDDEITMQEVPYGGNATQPADPVVEGKRFVSWDGSFTNITEETTISAIFEDDASVTTASTSVTFDTTETTTSDSRMFTVTVVVNGNATTQQVAYGGSAVLPAVNIPGYVFMDCDFYD